MIEFNISRFAEGQSEAPQGFNAMTFTYENGSIEVFVRDSKHEYRLVFATALNINFAYRRTLGGMKEMSGSYKVVDKWPNLYSVVEWMRAHPNALRDWEIRAIKMDLEVFEKHVAELRRIISEYESKSIDLSAEFATLEFTGNGIQIDLAPQPPSE